MKKPHQEELLQDLYKQTKSKVRQPAQVTKQVLDYAKASRSQWGFLVQWQTVCAALLIGFLWIQNHEKPAPVYTVSADYTETNELIYYHQVDFRLIDEDTSKQGNMSLSEEPEYHAYLASLSKLNNATQLTGVVKRSKGDVVVEVCQLGLVKLSEDLLKQIDKPSVIDQLSIGQSVLLLADNHGKFIDIQQRNTSYQCAD